MMTVVKCKSGAHELSMTIDDCAYCKLEQQARQLAAMPVLYRALRLIITGIPLEMKTEDFTIEQVKAIAKDALDVYARTKANLAYISVDQIDEKGSIKNDT